MKKSIIIAFVGLFVAAGTYAQDIITASDFSSEDLVAMTGTEQEYYLQKDENFRNEEGLKTGKLLSFHENGNLEESGMLIKNKRFGTWKKYSESGALLTEAQFIDGKKHGEWKVWDENGVLRLHISYDNGERVGSWLMYDETGNLIKETKY